MSPQGKQLKWSNDPKAAGLIRAPRCRHASSRDRIKFQREAANRARPPGSHFAWTQMNE